MTLPGKKTAGIILAAGSGSRMGKTKQLLPFGKTTLLGQVVEAAKRSALHEIIIVLGYKAEKIRKTLDPANAKIIINKESSKGQSTSLIKGLENVSSACDAAMFLLGDQPLVTAGIINQLIDAFESTEALITIPYCNEKRGNPVIIARPLFYRIKSLSGDTGARDIFDAFQECILRVEIPDTAIFNDVDTMDDYKNLITIPDHQQG